MFVQIDVGAVPPRVTLEQPDDTKVFHVRVLGGRDLGLAYGALVDAAAGRLEGEDAWIAADAVRRMARGRVGPTWDGDFAGMLDYARSKGWLDEPGHTIRAHVEWLEST